jgi:hypothetical protein
MRNIKLLRRTTWRGRLQGRHARHDFSNNLFIAATSYSTTSQQHGAEVPTIDQRLSNINISGTALAFVGSNTTNCNTIVQDRSHLREHLLVSLTSTLRLRNHARPPPVPSSNVPFRLDVDFVDRRNLLNQIDDKCAEVASRVVPVGIGGVG